MRIRSILTHLGQALLEGALIAALVAVLVAGTAFAGKPSGGGTVNGSCSVSPNPTVVGGMYTVSGSGLKPYELINVWVSDSHGTQTLFPPVDANGTFTASSYSSWSGTSNVTVYDNGGRKIVKVAACSFVVN